MLMFLNSKRSLAFTSSEVLSPKILFSISSLESLVLEGVTLNALANAIDAPVQVTGLKDIESVELDGFADITSSELFDSTVLPNKIEIFEGDESYAFVMMTQALQPSVQAFVDVADLAIQEVRKNKANIIINDFAEDAEGRSSRSKGKLVGASPRRCA